MQSSNGHTWGQTIAHTINGLLLLTPPLPAAAAAVQLRAASWLR
jgi:hypothetical protein